MTQDELKAWLLLSGFIETGRHTYMHNNKKLCVMFSTHDVLTQKYGMRSAHRWGTFRSTPQAAFDFIKEQLQ